MTGAAPAYFVVQNLEPWYASLKKPSWSPPNNIFAPVWTSLYALIGLACARALGAPGSAPRAALNAWAVQFVLNLSWAPLFFGAHRIRLAFFVSCALLASAISMTAAFAAVSSGLTPLLLVPYLAWLVFATGLNLSLWRLNGAST